MHVILKYLFVNASSSYVSICKCKFILNISKVNLKMSWFNTILYTLIIHWAVYFSFSYLSPVDFKSEVKKIYLKSYTTRNIQIWFKKNPKPGVWISELERWWQDSYLENYKKQLSLSYTPWKQIHTHTHKHTLCISPNIGNGQNLMERMGFLIQPYLRAFPEVVTKLCILIRERRKRECRTVKGNATFNWYLFPGASVHNGKAYFRNKHFQILPPPPKNPLQWAVPIF